MHKPVHLYASGLGKNSSGSPGQVAEIDLQKCDLIFLKDTLFIQR